MAWRSSNRLRASGARSNVYRFRYLPARHSAGATNSFPALETLRVVFQDDFPLNGEHDGGGGIDVLSPNEAGLGQFNIILFDDAGGTGDATGQMTYDMFNMPLNNSLAGTIDPATKFDACPISTQATNDPTQKGFTGTIVTCPKYESDGKTLSPLAGQASLPT